jgi:uncharacterized MAPEG superfamily protein
MTTELWILLWAAALGLVHILAAAFVWTGEVGLQYNASARDEPREVKSVLAGRLQRAQRNFFETFPLFAAAILAAVVAGRTSGNAELGGWIYLAGRTLYLPAYAAGIPFVRSLIWVASLIGLVMVWLAAAGILG